MMQAEMMEAGMNDLLEWAVMTSHVRRTPETRLEGPFWLSFATMKRLFDRIPPIILTIRNRYNFYSIFRWIIYFIYSKQGQMSIRNL